MPDMGIGMGRSVIALAPEAHCHQVLMDWPHLFRDVFARLDGRKLGHARLLFDDCLRYLV